MAKGKGGKGIGTHPGMDGYSIRKNVRQALHSNSNPSLEQRSAAERVMRKPLDQRKGVGD